MDNKKTIELEASKYFNPKMSFENLKEQLQKIDSKDISKIKMDAITDKHPSNHTIEINGTDEEIANLMSKLDRIRRAE